MNRFHYIKIKIPSQQREHFSTKPIYFALSSQKPMRTVSDTLELRVKGVRVGFKMSETKE